MTYLYRDALMRRYALVHKALYSVWVALLLARVALLIALIGVLALSMVIDHAHAQSRDVLHERQQLLTDILTDATLASVRAHRPPCAGGKQPAMTVRNRKLGAATLPDAADYCITILTRLGREGALPSLGDTSIAKLRPALAFDGGFVAGFTARETLPADAPAMMALKPVAERCLAQSEPSAALCTSAGYIIGLRAAHGETVKVSGL